MANLTEEQIIIAHRLLLESGYAVGGKLINKVATHLQFPWDEPTDEEVETAQLHINNGSATIKSTLRHFVMIRNAALIPKPEDPRIDIVAGALCHASILHLGHSLGGKESRALAAFVVSVLDEVK